MSLLFALTCCLCAAVNDLVFHRYARKVRSRGAYILIIGIVWTILFAIFTNFEQLLRRDALFWGIFSGIFSVAANILLVESMIYNDAGKCSTIYRLNLIFVAIGAFLLLNETVTAAKLLGITFALCAVLMFFLDTPRDGHHGKLAKLGLYMVGTAALLRAGMGLSYKYALCEGVDRNALLLL